MKGCPLKSIIVRLAYGAYILSSILLKDANGFIVFSNLLKNKIRVTFRV